MTHRLLRRLALRDRTALAGLAGQTLHETGGWGRMRSRLTGI